MTKTKKRFTPLDIPEGVSGNCEIKHTIYPANHKFETLIWEAIRMPNALRCGKTMVRIDRGIIGVYHFGPGGRRHNQTRIHSTRLSRSMQDVRDSLTGKRFGKT
jgi:hypothetical protein